MEKASPVYYNPMQVCLLLLREPTEAKKHLPTPGPKAARSDELSGSTVEKWPKENAKSTA